VPHYLLFEVKDFILICFVLEVSDKAFGTFLNVLLHLQLESYILHWTSHWHIRFDWLSRV